MKYREIAPGWQVPVPLADEAERLAELACLELLDSEPEALFDQVTASLASILRTHSR